MGLIGFAPAEVEFLIENHGESRGAEPAPEDEAPAPDRSASPITRPGDLWLLGQHRLLCGDARDGACYKMLLAGETVRAIVTDPPYNVKIDGHVSSGRRHREFAMASGELSPLKFTAFLRTVFDAVAAVSDPGALAYVFMDWRHLREALAAGDEAFDELLNIIVWNKMSAGMGSFYRSQHELVLLFRTTAGQHLNTVELGRHGRNRSKVWSCRGFAGFGEGREEALAMHPTVKPVAMIADALLDCTRRRDLVLDPFGGSGTMLISAQKTNRRPRVMEIDPHYCEVAIRRWQGFTGRRAVHATTEMAFDDIACEKAA